VFGKIKGSQAVIQSPPYVNETSQQIILHGVCVGVNVFVGVTVGDNLGVVDDGVTVGVNVFVGVTVTVGVGVTVGVNVFVGVTVTVGVGVTVLVGVGVGGQNVLSSHLEALAFNTSSTLLMFAHKTSLSLVTVPIF
jgi:UDP-3-O-[3-hydroxymyristoyl] glucosamine N-acyltransferase